MKVIYNNELENSIKEIQKYLKAEYPISKRSVSLLLLQNDNDMHQTVKEKESDYDRIEEIVDRTSGNHSYPLNYLIKMRLQNEASKIASSSTKKKATQEISLKEKLSRAMITPITGIPILIGILYLGLYQFVGVFGAQTLVDFIETDLFGEKIIPVVSIWVINNIPFVPVQELLVGEYGVISLGVTYAIALILPIVGTFFLMFSIVEDTGYLPRMALLIDRMFKKIGLSGRAVIPMVLGLGCDTMATMVTRTLETKRERVISTLLLAVAIPCSAQLGVIFAILAVYPNGILVWSAVLMTVFVFIGFLASKIMPGERPSFYMELPPLRLPKLTNVFTKTYTRMVWYFKEVFPLFIAASVLIWFGQLVGIFQLVVSGLQPVVNFIGLPDETAKVFLFGFFRRDYGAAGLYGMQDALTGLQLTVAAVTLTLFVPCIAQFMMMLKERGKTTAFSIFGFNILFAFAVGFVLSQILTYVGVIL